jgi:hypothetical protein
MMTLNELPAIGERLRTQDNRMTQNPMFCVQEKITITGLDSDYASETKWYDVDNDMEEVPEPEDGLETGSIKEFGIYTYWRTVMVAFTEDGCKEYLHLNGHNHRGETRIYVESFNRCPEMIAIREALMAAQETKGVQP